jgi:hypothetical protein
VSAPVPDHGEHYNFASARGGLRPRLPENLDTFANTRTGPVDEPRTPSPSLEEEKSVKFDLEPKEEPSRESSSDSERAHGHRDDHSHKRHRRRKDDDRSDTARDSGRARKRRHRSESPGSDTSDTTIDLPPRFDEQGRQQPEDPLAEKLETILQSIFR